MAKRNSPRIPNGTPVKIRESLLYTGETGVIEDPEERHPEDPWDYNVRLDSGRLIGVYGLQVEVVNIEYKTTREDLAKIIAQETCGLRGAIPEQDDFALADIFIDIINGEQRHSIPFSSFRQLSKLLIDN